MSLPAHPLLTLQRVYSAHYLVDVGGQPGNDQAFFVHPNGLVVLCLAQGHAALQLQPGDAPLAFSFGESLLLSEVSGKRKRGGLTLRQESAVATLSAGGQVYCLRTGLRAKLLEANARLEQAPQLLCNAHGEGMHDGWLAILMPFEEALEGLKQRALGRYAYESAVAARRDASRDLL